MQKNVILEKTARSIEKCTDRMLTSGGCTLFWGEVKLPECLKRKTVEAERKSI